MMFDKMKAWIFSAVAALFFVVSIAGASPAFAQTTPAPAPAPAPSGGGWFGIGDLFKDNTAPKTFDQRRQAAITAMGGKDNCWACDVFNQFSNQVFEKGAEAGAAGASLVPVISGFATVFALFYLGSGFVAGDASDLAQRWTVFWRLCIAAAAGAAVLKANSFNFVWDYVYGPLFSIGTAIANSFGATASGCSPGAPGGGPPGAADAIASMYGIVCGGHQMSIDGIAIGMAVGTQVDGFINTLIYGVAGIIIIIMFVWIMISFPLRFIDVLIRMGIVGIITPLLVIAAVFKPTRGYISIGISNVLNAAAQFAITAVMFAVGHDAFMKLISNLKLDAGASGSMWTTNSSTVDTLSSAVVLVGMAAIFGAMLRSVPSIAAEFSQYRGSGGDTIGNSATGAAATAVTMPIKGAGMAAGGVAGVSAARRMATSVGTQTGNTVAQALQKGVAGAPAP